MRFCASVNGIASAGLRPMDIACNLENCYNIEFRNLLQKLQYMPFPVKHAAFANKGLLKTPTQKQLSRRKTNVYRLTVNNFDIYFSLYLCKLENSHIITYKNSGCIIESSLFCKSFKVVFRSVL